MPAENEEFEFRLRAEKEAAAAPKVGMDTGQDTSSKEAFLASGQKPVKSEPISMPNPWDAVRGPLEAATTVATGMGGQVVGNIAGVAKRATGASMQDAEKTAADIAQKVTYEPRSAHGRRLTELIGGGFEASKLGGMGPAEQIAAAGAPRLGVTGKVSRETPKPRAAETPKSGAGAESAVNELQRQRNVAEGVDKPANLAGMGAHEAAVLERDKVTTPLRQQYEREGSRVDVKPVLHMIEKLKGEKGSSVGAALDQAKKEIELALKNSGGGAGNGMVSAYGDKFVLKDGKLVKGSPSAEGAGIKNVEEARQEINRLINGTGEKALDGHTKDLLGQIRDKMVDGTSPAYKKYLEEYTRLSKPIDEFTAAGGAAGKVTTDKAAFHLLNPADKQNMLTAAFKSDTPGRALTELMRDTAHHPEAAQGVRAAYTEWLTHVDDTVKMLPTAGGLTKRWEQTRAAVKSSGLMDETHIKAMDVIMDDVRDAASKTGVKKAWASTAGFLFGNTVGHPIVAAHAARDLIGGTKSEVTQKALEAAMMKIAASPNGAKALAAAPTPKNIETVRAMLPTDVAAAVAPVAAREEQSRKRRDPYSMQPSF